MKSKLLKQLTVLILAAAVPVVFTSCGEAGHDGHDDHEHHEGDGHDHEKVGEDHDKAGDEHAGHDHADSKNVRPAGPNGGRIITDVEPHVEFLVTEDRKVKFTSLNDDNKPSGTAPAFEVALTGGDRSNPTRLQFAAEGTSLVSSAALPKGKMIPVVLQFKSGEDKPTMTKFNIDLNDCPTCKYKEYACTCAHAGDHDDHDHKHE
ncbi:hypothetical protein OAL55_00755 [Verrucomicrobiales bacterium]|nr:hypothetical protein [Verrucomicrobiales bacterium]MDC0276769.1 hypothetical protein [Verrucomicrobiales bacterium]MDC0321867.1 hypothetical protein [Verrucomicrobiales bacterium]